MKELFLIYDGQDSGPEEVLVSEEKFVIGRHSQSDLPIPDPRLSRQHVRIERFAEVFVVSDLGSSNGTTLNGAALTEPKTLEDGDVLELGGLEIRVELRSDEESQEEEAANTDEPPAAASAPAAGSSAGAAPGGGSLFGNAFFLAPIMGVGILLLVGAGALVWALLAGGSETSSGSGTSWETPYDDLSYSTPESTPSDDGGDPNGLTPSRTQLPRPRPTSPHRPFLRKQAKKKS